VSPGVISVTSGGGRGWHFIGAGRRCPNTRAGQQGRTAQVNPDLPYGPAAHAAAGPLFLIGAFDRGWTAA